jgi:HipA-like protein
MNRYSQNNKYAITAEVFIGKEKVGVLSKVFDKNQELYVFVYDKMYCENEHTRPLVPMMPKTLEPYYSEILFPIFFSLLSEGNIKKLQCQMHKIDENDYFQLLLKTCVYNTIAGIKIREITPQSIAREKYRLKQKQLKHEMS